MEESTPGRSLAAMTPRLGRGKQNTAGSSPADPTKPAIILVGAIAAHKADFEEAGFLVEIIPSWAEPLSSWMIKVYNDLRKDPTCNGKVYVVGGSTGTTRGAPHNETPLASSTYPPLPEAALPDALQGRGEPIEFQP